MSDIFGRADQVYAGGLTSDASWMFWSGLASGGLGMLITQMSIQYQQPIRRIYEIGPWTSVGGVKGSPVYYVAGRPEGQLQMGRIAGPVAALGGFYRTYGNICSYFNDLFFVSSSGCIGGLPAGGVGAVAAGAAAAFGGADVNRRVAAGRSDPYLGWYMNGVVITAIGLSAQAQDMLLTENVQMMFVSLRLYTVPAALGDAGFWPWVEL